MTPEAPDAPAGTTPDSAPPPAPRKLWRFAALVALIVGSIVLAKVTGVTEQLTPDRIRGFMEGAGVLGFLIFLGVFAVGELVHVPGVFFVAAAILAYGRGLGGVAAYVGAVLSVIVSFAVVRGVGGQVLAEVRRPWVRKILDGLERRPVRVVALLRLILWMAPPLNYALAMSAVRFRDYVLGSALGLILPIAAAALFFDWVVATFLS
ncbi:MAG: VTT domain-containing protein [Sandaracinus sp.]|nr:VTT domain-containing protein [Sandaracinus sp.]MCB9615991.1 VTT domain-containing protein [Sandaracinus sp.]MCB9618608.1 VTT domain-containing protein [Sandaracinus sp.]MCB9630741.1 VTT domain-containing protein [Sandaracinus sp.]